MQCIQNIHVFTLICESWLTDKFQILCEETSKSLFDIKALESNLTDTKYFIVTRDAVNTLKLQVNANSKVDDIK